MVARSNNEISQVAHEGSANVEHVRPKTLSSFDLASEIAKLTYYSLEIPYTETNPSAWHPHNATGPFSTLSSGAFKTLALAHEWAAKHLNGNAYNVVLCTMDANPDGSDAVDVYLPVHTVNAVPAVMGEHTITLNTDQLAAICMALRVRQTQLVEYAQDCFKAQSSDNTRDENASYVRNARSYYRKAAEHGALVETLETLGSKS
jgi:hypothetical protein